MKNFETPKMELAMFETENILTESATPVPTLQAIGTIAGQDNALVAQKSFNDLIDCRVNHEIIKQVNLTCFFVPLFGIVKPQEIIPCGFLLHTYSCFICRLFCSAFFFCFFTPVIKYSIYNRYYQ